MKKILKLSFLALLAFPALVGCGGQQESGNQASGVDAAAKKAISQIGVYYGQYSGSEGINLAGADLYQQFTVDEYTFDLSYVVAPIGATYEAEYLKIEGTKLVVEIPTFAELNAYGSKKITYAAYSLTATLKHDGQEMAQKGNWKIRINAEDEKPVWQKISEARKKTSGTVVTSGYVVALMNDKQDGEFSNGVWIADGGDGMMLYGGNLAAYFSSLHIGTYVFVSGAASPYNGLFEVKPSVINLTETPREGVQQPVFTVTSEAQLNAFTTDNCSDPVTCENVTITTDVATLKDAAASTAITIGLKVGNTAISYFANKHTATADRQALVDLLKANAGKTCTVKSIMGYNSGTFQISGAVLTAGGSLADNFIFAD